MTYEQLYGQILKKQSFLCVGLDTDLEKIPLCVREQVRAAALPEEEAVFAFNRQIVDATAPYCVAFKVNTAFYEALG